jgi:hypothetical protein
MDNLLYGRWLRLKSRSTGKYYFFCAKSNSSFWEDTSLPEGWAFRLSGPEAPREYVNLIDDRTTFELPTASSLIQQTKSSITQHTSSEKPLTKTSNTSTSTTTTITATEGTTDASAQLSFQASRAAGDDLGSRAYIPEVSSHGANIPATVASKRDYLFSVLIPKDRLWRVQCDEVSLYSVTEGRAAERMTNLIIEELRHLGCVKNDLVITDATACVGGNSLSFARSDAVVRVNAVELSHQRASMLEHNFSLLMPQASSKGKVYCGDFCALAGISEGNDKVSSVPLGSGQQDCVFMDPPWGGPEYKSAANLDMFLGPIDVADVVVSLLRSGPDKLACSKLVAIKAPLNYNVAGLRHKLSAAGMGEGEATLKEVTMHKMMLLFARQGLAGRRGKRSREDEEDKR